MKRIDAYSAWMHQAIRHHQQRITTVMIYDSRLKFLAHQEMLRCSCSRLWDMS